LSCAQNGNRAAAANQRNGIVGQVGRYLNTLGSWSTYRDLNKAEEIPERIAQVTATFLGVKGFVAGHPRLTGLLGVIIGIHALEQVTGGLATTGMRLYARGQPVARYRGLLIRKSPFTPRQARLLNRVTGGRVLAANGYYFFEGGRTWHCQSMTLQVGDTPRSFTRVQSFSLPQREYFFDRPVSVPGAEEAGSAEKNLPIQRVVDVIKGAEEPDGVPGFIGSVNELEGLTPLKGLKHALFAANWLLLDEGEREGQAEQIDYEGLVKGTGQSSGLGRGGVYQVARSVGSAGSGWPSTSRIPIRSVDRAGTAQPYGANLFSSRKPAPSPPRRPAEQYRDRLRIGEREYPLVVKRVTTHPLSGQRKADAVYYDDTLQQWRAVVEDEDKIKLARAVDAGRLAVVDPADWPMGNY
jgi:hypothetical protein